MKCRYCGAKVPEGTQFCHNCGAFLGDPNDRYSREEPNYYPPPTPPKPGLSAGAIVAAILFVLVVVMMLTVGIFMLTNKKNNDKAEAKKSVATETQQEAAPPASTNSGTPIDLDYAPSGYGSSSAKDYSGSSVPAIDYDDGSEYEPGVITNGPNSDYSSGSSSSSSSDFIFPDSGTRLLSQSELQGLTQDELIIARNEISARKGRRFDTDWIQAYFNNKSWYTGKYSPEEFDAATEYLLSPTEQQNMETILNYEHSLGYYY